MQRFPRLFISALVSVIFFGAVMPVVPATFAPRQPRAIVPFDLTRIGRETVAEFAKAWRISKCGTSDAEGVVLFYATPDGGYRVKTPNSTNQYRAFTFQWDDDIIAIFHTHPRRVDPRPSPKDMEVADKYNVLMFTLTLQGLYVYDPQSKKTHIVIAGMDWLDAGKWTEALADRMAAVSSSFSSRLAINSQK